MKKNREVSAKMLSMVFVLLLVGLSFSGLVYAQETAPNFTLTDIDGGGFSLSDFKESTVVLSFISTRVIFCKVVAHIFVNVSKFFGDDVVFILIGVSNDTVSVGGDSEKELREFRDECSFEGFVARDTKGVARDYDVNYIPLTFIIDQAGYVRHKHFGAVALTEQVLIGELQMIVPEFSSPLLLLSLMVFAALVMVLSKRNAPKLTNLS